MMIPEWLTFRLVALLTLIFFGVPTSGVGKTLTEKYEKLRGVKGFELDVVPLSVEATSVGLSEDMLRFLVEANLKRGELPLEKRSSRAVPYLLVDVRVVCSPDAPVCGYVLSLRFDDVVELRGSRTYAQTWAWNYSGIAGQKEVTESVLGALRDRGMPTFVRDFLAANP